MKKKLVMSIGAAVLICTMGSAQAFAMARTGFPANNPSDIERPLDGGRGMRGDMAGDKPEGMTDRQGGFRRDLTDEDKNRMDSERLQHSEKLQAFIDSLSSEQKALYDAMTPAKREKLTEGQQRTKPDENFMSDMKEKRETFIASLSNDQKAVYDDLFSRQGFKNGKFGMRGDKPSDKPEGMHDRQDGSRRDMTDGDRSQMSAVRLQHSEKLNAFIDSLNSEQKALYDAMVPAKMDKPKDGQKPVKPDENFMSNMKEKQEAFVASLSESQKAVYDELFGKSGRMFGKPGGERNN